LNASASLERSKGEVLHRAYLCLGSNIDPEENMRRAVALLSEHTRVIALSRCWESEAIGSIGPNFLNMAACIETPLDVAVLKEQVLARIEHQLGRVRTSDKNAPRTIDLDITLFDGQVRDQHLWERAYLALTIAELLPEFCHPESGETLPQLAARLHATSPALLRDDVSI
jgi:2-amino-4-hydroxy-6-hydroxymethyldihydropteridine diphosphokinase